MINLRGLLVFVLLLGAVTLAASLQPRERKSCHAGSVEAMFTDCRVALR